MNDEFFMNEALKEAKLSLKEGNWPIGCVIELGGKIIARTHNQVYTNQDKTAHAEMLALKKVQGTLRKNKRMATLYSTYEPCPMCFGAIILSKIKRVVAGANIDRSGAMFLKKNLPELFKQDHLCVDLTNGILESQCREIFLQGKPTQKLIEKGLIKTD